MVLVAYQERDIISFDKLSDIRWSQVENFIAVEGIYVFGGVKGQTAIEESCTD